MNNRQISTLEKYNKCVKSVLGAIASGFTSLSSKKSTMTSLNRCYEELENAFIRAEILDIADRNEYNQMTEEWKNLYWSVPGSLRQWEESFVNTILCKLPQLSDTVSKITDLKTMYDEVKVSDVNKPEPKPITALEQRIHKAMKDEMEKIKSDFAYGVKLAGIFGKLPVSINAHYVVNQFGTEFIRCFYYLGGKLVKLNTIIAIMQDLETKNKK
jgi:hypothetical protein